jgi:predicted nuclease with TOPRIM domain
MTTQELSQVKELVLRELPQALAQDTELALLIEGMLSEKFPHRDEFAQMLLELRASRQETRERFSQIDQRFEQLDHRFQQVDQRFEQVDQRFQQVDQRFEQVVSEIRGLRSWMELNVGGFQTKVGRRLEDVVAGAFCYGLERTDIGPEHVKLRQKITDNEGVVFRAGKTRELDIIVLADEIIVFEVKWTADFDDIDDLADKVELVRCLNPGKKTEGVLVMLGAEKGDRELCEKKGLRLIP